jgi:hypothetical protein
MGEAPFHRSHSHDACLDFLGLVPCGWYHCGIPMPAERSDDSFFGAVIPQRQARASEPAVAADSRRWRLNSISLATINAVAQHPVFESSSCRVDPQALGGVFDARFSPAAYLTTRTRSTVTSAPPVTISSRIGSNRSTCASSSTTSISTGKSAESSGSVMTPFPESQARRSYLLADSLTARSLSPKRLPRSACFDERREFRECFPPAVFIVGGRHAGW